MRKTIGKILRNIFKPFGYTVVNEEHLRKITNESQYYKNRDIDNILLNSTNETSRELYQSTRDKSHSQILQDMFVLSTYNFKKNGFFVEFGATNGISLSNTYLLEKEFNWTGILAEPSKSSHNALISNRNVKIDKRCVWKNTGEHLTFNEIGDLSTIDHFSNDDMHENARKRGVKYEVETVSLIDLLEQHNAPYVIDYLSIDTEGSEFEILERFDFEKYDIRVITCEHNYTKNRDKIYNLLKSKGFERKYEKVSRFDDWYVKH